MDGTPFSFRPSAAMRRRVFPIVALLCLLLVSPKFATAADEAFVGVLALAVDSEVADEIGLTPAVRSQLEDFVDEREAEALEMALTMRDLPAEQQEQKLAAFRAESERQGLLLLHNNARKRLAAIRLRKTGFSSLATPSIAQQLGLTESQSLQIADLISARDANLAQVGSSKAVVVRKNFERQLKAVLSPEQIADWRALTGTQTLDTSAQKKNKQVLAATGSTAAEQTSTPNNPTPGNSAKLQFSFRYAPWQNVIEWFAEQCDLSLLMDAPPQGTFNYSDPRTYSQAQAIDLLNSVLLTKGYTLIRREKMLLLINLEDGIPPNLVSEVTEEELDGLGEYELVRCIFTLESVNAESAQEEIDRLLGPQGTVHVLTSSNQLAITETAGRLRTFRRILQQGEQQNASALGQAQLVTLEHVRASKIISSWRSLMGLTDEDNAALDGSLRVTQGKSPRELLISGKPHSIRDFQELVDILDVAPSGGPRDVPQLEVYSISEADPESVLNVLDTLLEDVQDIRMTTDPQSRSLVALARPDEHETIRATIDQLQADRRKVEVIRLRSIDPQLAMLSIEKLFAPPPGEDETAQANVPIVDADPITRSLMIRGSDTQIEDIRTLLSKMGEDESADGRRGIAGGGGNLRMLPIDAGTARRAMQQLNTIWPTVRGNRIRMVTPSSRIRGIRTNRPSGPEEAESSPADGDVPTSRRPAANRPLDPDSTTSTQPTPQPGTSNRNHVANVPTATRFVVNQLAENGADDSDGGELADVIVTIGDQGLLIASEDLEALDEFEELFRTLSDRLFAGSRELSIFYLRYAKAEVAAEFVKQFVGGSSGSSGGGTLLGNLAGAALGGSGGGIIGTLLGGGSSSSVSLSRGTAVIADPRLNALVVQATPKELDFIEGLLQVLDRANSPEIIETVPRPRAIPVIHADAEEVAEIVRDVYAPRLAGSQMGRARQPSPEEFLKAIAGQKNTGKEIAAAIGEQVEITISVDTRRNALIVIAPESLFNEIRSLVTELDFATPERDETIRYGSVGSSSPEMIRTVVETLMEEDQEADDSTNARRTNSRPQLAEPRQAAPSVEEIKRRMEFLKAIQKATARDQAVQKKSKPNAAASSRDVQARRARPVRIWIGSAEHSFACVRK